MPADFQLIRQDDPAYPPSLTRVYRPPSQLYVRGQTAVLQSDRLLAVVGSRKATAYGQQAIIKLLTPAVRAGIILISGLAYGIDSMAHRLCLELSQPTIAVLGSGLDDASLYPQAHRGLAQRIVQHGAVVTEYPPLTPPHLGHFPARNRLIAGLARATLVVQAAARSGSLITARLALDSGKDVLAVPGAITDPLSAGTNQLIQQGATPALTPQDILDLFGLSASAALVKTAHQLDTDQQLLLRTLTSDPQHIDELAQRTHLPPHTVSAALIQLEMLDAVHNVGGMQYVKNS
ncbi:MAG: DNA-protecting protein DprA [Candidatus Andersenbacteria bacterium]|nr:DNA-protecting protein DprA [Candidatus Andersenbacteria bacterium]